MNLGSNIGSNAREIYFDNALLVILFNFSQISCGRVDIGTTIVEEPRD